MPVNNMNVGVDYSFGYYDANSGALIALGDVQNVRRTAQKHDIASRPYNGPPRFGYVPDGHSFEFTITRTKSTIDDLMVTREANFNAGSIDQPGYLNETVTNPDGSISRYQYTGFVFFMNDPGDVARDTVVTVKCEGRASQKVAIA